MKLCLNSIRKSLHHFVLFISHKKGMVGVPPLAMVADLVCPVVRGIESVLVISFINAKRMKVEKYLEVYFKDLLIPS